METKQSFTARKDENLNLHLIQSYQFDECSSRGVCKYNGSYQQGFSATVPTGIFSKSASHRSSSPEHSKAPPDRTLTPESSCSSSHEPSTAHPAGNSVEIASSDETVKGIAIKADNQAVSEGVSDFQLVFTAPEERTLTYLSASYPCLCKSAYP